MSLTETQVDFKSFEREVFRLCCEIGRDALREALAQYDVELSTNRDKSAYRAKGLRRTAIK